MYPEHKFDHQQARIRGGKAQHLLFRLVQMIFPNRKVALDYYHPALIFLQTNRHMQLDVYVPSLYLALEYQVHE